MHEVEIGGVSQETLTRRFPRLHFYGYSAGGSPRRPLPEGYLDHIRYWALHLPPGPTWHSSHHLAACRHRALIRIWNQILKTTTCRRASAWVDHPNYKGTRSPSQGKETCSLQPPDIGLRRDVHGFISVINQTTEQHREVVLLPEIAKTTMATVLH